MSEEHAHSTTIHTHVTEEVGPVVPFQKRPYRCDSSTRQTGCTPSMGVGETSPQRLLFKSELPLR